MTKSPITPEPSQSTMRYALILMASLLVILVSLGIVAARPDYARREAQVAALSATEQDRLMRNWERFRTLDETQQQRLIAVERQILADQQSDSLLATLDEYYDWLKNLAPGQRYDLRRMQPQERLARVQQLYGQEQSEQARRHDRIVLLEWLEERSFSRLPDEQRQRIAARPPLERRAEMMRQRMRGGHSMDDLQPAEVEALIARLGPGLADKLQQADDLDDARRVLRTEIGELYRHMFTDRQNLFSDEALAQNQAALKEFFEHELDDDDRDRLLSLPPDEMQRSLQREYFQRQFPEMVGADRRRPDFVSPQRSRGSSSRPATSTRDRIRRGRSDEVRPEEGNGPPPAPATSSEGAFDDDAALKTDTTVQMARRFDSPAIPRRHLFVGV